MNHYPNFLVRQNLAHRQTAAVYLRKLAEAGVVTAKPTGKTTYYVNQRLIDILTD